MSGSRRAYGSGSIFTKTDRQGKESWYGRWYVGPRRVKRKLGPKRAPGTTDGLTRKQAEKELRRRIQSEAPASPTDGITIADAGNRMLRHLQSLGRKPTTLATYRSTFRTHIEPAPFGDLPLEGVTEEVIERRILDLQDAGKAPKTIANTITLLSQVFAYAQRRSWCSANPCTRVARPSVEQSVDIRFLDLDELEGLLRAVDVDAQPYGHLDRSMYLTAAMTGLRQGELLALRWRDVDWSAGRIRVRRNYVRGHWGTPKSRRGSRAVPLPDRVGGELERLFQRSSFQADDDLVFGDPRNGNVLDHSALVRRFKKTLTAAGLRKMRFHDLRHTFGTHVAAQGVAMRRLQEWMGHRDIKTTQIYADYVPSDQEKDFVEAAFSCHQSPAPQ